MLETDETQIELCNGGKAWLWGVKCVKTKKVVASHVSKTRTLIDAKILFWEARRRFPPSYWPKIIRTDGLPAYRRAIFEVLGPEVKHDKFISFKEHNNNDIENTWRIKKLVSKIQKSGDGENSHEARHNGIQRRKRRNSEKTYHTFMASNPTGRFY